MRLLHLILVALLCAGCATLEKTPVRAHWIDANESAPFSGLLIDENIYKRMRVKLLQCEK